MGTYIVTYEGPPAAEPLTAEQAAYHLGITVTLVWLAVDRGDLKPLRRQDGGADLFRQRDLAEWFMAHGYRLREGKYPEPPTAKEGDH